MHAADRPGTPPAARLAPIWAIGAWESAAVSELVIRPARAEEAELLAAVVAEAYGHYVARIGRRPGPMDDDYASRIAAGQAHVAEDANGILGLAVIDEDEEGIPLLDNVAVRPAAQGRGIGRALIAFAEERARAVGSTELRLYTHERMFENITLYARLGFVETARRVENGFPRVFMTKRLR